MSGLTFTLASGDGPLQAIPSMGGTIVSLFFTTPGKNSPVFLTMPYAPGFPGADQSSYLNNFLQTKGGFYLGQPYTPIFSIPSFSGLPAQFYLSQISNSNVYQVFPISQGGDSAHFPTLNMYLPNATWGQALPLTNVIASSFPTVNGSLTLTWSSGTAGSQLLYSPTNCTQDCGNCGIDYCPLKDQLNSNLFACNNGQCQPLSPVQIAFSIRQQTSGSGSGNVLTYNAVSINGTTLYGILPYYLPQSSVPALTYPPTLNPGGSIFAPQEYWFFADLYPGQTTMMTGSTYPLYIFDVNDNKFYLQQNPDSGFITTTTPPTPGQYSSFLTFTPSLSGNWQSYLFPPSDFTSINQFIPAPGTGNTTTSLSSTAPLGLWTVPSITGRAVAGPNLPTLKISPTTLPSGTVGTQYSQQLSVATTVKPPNLSNPGTPASYTWTNSGGNLPLGLSLNSNTGLISGIPTTAGLSTFTINVVDNTDSSKFGSNQYTNVAISSSGGGTGSNDGGGTGGNGNLIWGLPWWGWLIIIVVVFIIVIISIGFVVNRKPSPSDIPLKPISSSESSETS